METLHRQSARPTLLIISQVYVPDPAAVGQQIADLAGEMVHRGWNVVVYTSARGYDDPQRRYQRREVIDGVDVRRLPLSSFGKSSIAIRLIAGALFLAQAVLRALFVPRLRVILVSTSPPFAGIGGTLLSWVRATPLVWWVMDLNPDQMVAAGRLASSSLAVRLFEWMNRLTLSRARDVIVLDEYMKRRIANKGPYERKVHVVPPWPHDTILTAPFACSVSFRQRHGLGDAFVVMYSGNHAIQHPLDTLLEAASRLADRRDVIFVFIGGGAGKQDVDRRVREGAQNILSLPFQPLHDLGESLAAADVHVVAMGNEVVGIVHPCKVYGAMAVGRPILFFGPAESHVGDIMAEHDIGVRVEHGDVDGAIAAIAKLAGLSSDTRNAIGEAALAVVQGSFSQRLSMNKVADILCGQRNSGTRQVLP